ADNGQEAVVRSPAQAAAEAQILAEFLHRLGLVDIDAQDGEYFLDSFIGGQRFGRYPAILVLLLFAHHPSPFLGISQALQTRAARPGILPCWPAWAWCRRGWPGGRPRPARCRCPSTRRRPAPGCATGWGSRPAAPGCGGP